MALTRCKECKKEVSTQANTCPYCGVYNPGVIENNNNRRVGVIVLALLFFLFLYFLKRHERVDNQTTEIAEISDNTKTGISKVVQIATAVQPLDQPNLLEAPAMEDSTQSQQSSVLLTQQPPVSQEQPEQEKPKLDKTKAVSSTDTPQIMVSRMLEYALNDGGLSHESELLNTKLQIESSSKPAKGNPKAARAINAKGLVFSKKGEFNKAVKMFENAYKLDKSDSEIANNLGFSYLKLGNIDSAKQTITIALTLSPERATAWENLGEVFGVKGDISKAVACFSNAYRFSKDRSKMHQYMKKINENESVMKLKQARTKTITWAEKSYLNISKNTELHK
jgi:tetratricopeptide (TPR) repeat protein